MVFAEGDEEQGGDGFEDPGDDREAGGFGEELGGDPAGGADRDTGEFEDPGQDREAGGFGEELGGDPAGGADRDASGSADRAIGGFGEELGGDPAGEGAIEQRPEATQPRGERAREFVETAAAGMGPGSALERARGAARRGRAAIQQARQRPTDIFRRPEDFDVRDVFGATAVREGVTMEPDERVLGAFEDGQRAARRGPANEAEREAQAELVGRSPLIDPGDVVFVERDGRVVATVDAETADLLARTGFEQGQAFVERPARGVSREVEAGGGEDVGFPGGDPASIALAQAERNLEEALDADVDPRTDIEVTETADGIGVQLTDEGRDIVSSEAERRLEAAIEEETGRDVDLLPGDFRVTDEGGVELTQSGIDKVATEPLTEFVPAPPDELLGGIVETPIQAEPGGGGPIAEDVGIERDFGRAIGGIELGVPGVEGAGAELGAFGEATGGPREAVDTITVDEAIAEAVEALTFEFETLPAGERPVTPGPGVAPRARVPFEEAPREHQILAGGVEAAFSAPSLIPRGAGALVDVGDFTVELATEAIDLPEFDERPVTPGPSVAPRTQTQPAGIDLEAVDRLTSDAFQVAQNQAAVGAAGAIEEPAETAVRAAGTLAGSALVFGGAAAVGPRTSLATRGVIQPGEEALGIGGHALTRRVFGRSAAEKAFPGKEPLIFSEEAFLRQLRAAGSRAAGGARRGRAGAAELSGRFEPPTFGDIQGLALQTEIARFTARRRIMEGLETEAGVGGADLRFDEPVDVPALEAEGADPVEVDQPDAGDAGVVGGGGFDLEFEHRTPSGVVIEQVRVPAIEAPSLEPFAFETEAQARRRLEVTVDGMFEGVGIDPVEGVSPAELERFDQPIDPTLETPGEIEMPAEVEIAPPRLDLAFEPVDIEIEGEPGRETEREREQEFETFARQRQRFDRISEGIDVEFQTGVFEHAVPTVEEFERRFKGVFDGGRADDRKRKRRVDVEPVEAAGVDVDLDIDLNLDDIDPFG